MPDIKGNVKYKSRQRRARRTRAKLHGTQERPRMSIYRSLQHMHVQIINDDNGHTLVAASTVDPEIASQLEGKSKTEAAKVVGKAIGERAKEAGIETVVFDRGGFQYHGRVAALADAAREAGLKF